MPDDAPTPASAPSPVTASPQPAGSSPTDVRTRTERDDAAARMAAERRQHDNTARRADRAPRPPTTRELNMLRNQRFGDKAGSIAVATDLATGKTELVYTDGDGNETGREPFEPEGQARTPESAPAPADSGPAAPPAPPAKVDVKTPPASPPKR